MMKESLQKKILIKLCAHWLVMNSVIVNLCLPLLQSPMEISNIPKKYFTLISIIPYRGTIILF